MLILEYKLRVNTTQQAAIDEAIRTDQFVRNKALRVWMDGRGVGWPELQRLCAQLAKEYPFAARLHSNARQASADQAWASISRFYKNCREKKPGTPAKRRGQAKGYPRYQKDNRSVEHKVGGWKLEPDGKPLTFTDGTAIGTMRLIGKRSIETFPLYQIKRVRLVKRADGYSVQFGVREERKTDHQPTGKQPGIDGGLKAFYTVSSGATVANPRYLRKAEKRLKRLHRRVSRKFKRDVYRTKAIKCLARGYLKVRRQRKDFAAKAASALCKSNDLIAYEDLKIAHLVKNHHLAKSISDAGWGLFLAWVRYYGQVYGIPIVAVPARFTTQDCVSLWPSREEKSLHADAYVSLLWAGARPRLGRCAQHIGCCPGDLAATNRAAGQAETGSLQAVNASGQGTSGIRKRLRRLKLAG